MHTKHIQLIYRHLKGISSDEENAALETLRRESPDFSAAFEHYRHIWNCRPAATDSLTEAEHSTERNRLLDGMRAMPDKTHRIRITTQLTVAATAMLVLLVAVTVVVYNPHVVHVDKAGTKVTLPDSSRVTLNRYSSARFLNTGGERRIYLSGEAFLDIHPDPQHPLYIYAGNTIVKVTGTSLVVNAYPEKPVSIAVVSGSVEVMAGDSRIQVSANEIVKVNIPSGQFEKSINDNPNMNAWYTRRLVFNNTPLQRVINDLANYYDVSFGPLPTAVSDCRITGTFENEQLDVVLNLISLTLDFDVMYSNNQYVVADAHGCY